MAERPPLNWEASANPTNATVGESLPSEVVTCLRNTRFLHLATSSPTAEPHISLMSHTYLPNTPFTSGPTILMTTNPSSRKTSHLQSNPRVALLVHDWVSPRDDREAETNPAADDDATRRPSSSLASLLLGFNRAALGRISATIAGTARVLEAGSAEEKWCRARHVENHGFKGGPAEAVEDEEGADAGTSAATTPGTGAGATDGFLEGEDVRVVVVRVREGRIADWKGGVKDFVIRGEQNEQGEEVREGQGVNGTL